MPVRPRQRHADRAGSSGRGKDHDPFRRRAPEGQPVQAVAALRADVPWQGSEPAPTPARRRPAPGRYAPPASPYPRLRPRHRDGPGPGWLQRDVLHHRTRLGLGQETGTCDQDRHQHRNANTCARACTSTPAASPPDRIRPLPRRNGAQGSAQAFNVSCMKIRATVTNSIDNPVSQSRVLVAEPVSLARCSLPGRIVLRRGWNDRSPAFPHRTDTQ